MADLWPIPTCIQVLTADSEIYLPCNKTMCRSLHPFWMCFITDSCISRELAGLQLNCLWAISFASLKGTHINYISSIHQTYPGYIAIITTGELLWPLCGESDKSAFSWEILMRGSRHFWCVWFQARFWGFKGLLSGEIIGPWIELERVGGGTFAQRKKGLGTERKQSRCCPQSSSSVFGTRVMLLQAPRIFHRGFKAQSRAAEATFVLYCVSDTF